MTWRRATGWSGLILAVLILTERLLEAYLVRQGLFAGLAVGLVFGLNKPSTEEQAEDFVRALRTAVAFGVTTGIGFFIYKGVEFGLSWGIGGPIGVYSSLSIILLFGPSFRRSNQAGRM